MRTAEPSPTAATAVMTAPTGGRFTYRYDAAGRIERIINPEGDRTSYAYDAASRRTVKRLANGTRASFTYDAADNLTTLANMFPNGTYISKYDYKYDPTGNRYAVAEADGSRVTWLYDVLYQLTGENRTGTTPFRNTFSYDPLGNRLWKNESGTRTTYAYDAANQLRYGQEAAGRTTYTFDAAGNQAKEKTPAGAITTTTWNYENQPTLYRLPDATRVTMAYHPDLLRVQKDASTGTTKFVWDEQNYLAEADGANVVTTVYTTEPRQYGNLISTRLGTTAYYHCFDASRSTRHSTNSAYTSTNSWLFDAWGKQQLRTGSWASSMLWTGEVGYFCDPQNSSFYIRRRVYSDSAARWTAADPGFPLTESNEYRYAINSPVFRVDASGWVPKPCKCPGCSWNFSGWAAGLSCIIGYQYASVVARCLKAELRAYRNYTCRLGQTFQKPIHCHCETQLAFHVPSIGIQAGIGGIGILGNIKACSSNLIGSSFGWSASFQAIIIGIEAGCDFSGDDSGDYGGAGIAPGADFGVNVNWSGVNVKKSGLICTRAPLNAHEIAIVRQGGPCTSKDERAIPPRQVDNPYAVRPPGAEIVTE